MEPKRKPRQAPPEAPVPKEEPTLAEPWKWLWHHIHTDFPTLRKAPLGALCLLIGGGLFGWLGIGYVVIQNKDAVIEPRQATIDRLAGELVDYERMRAENLQLRGGGELLEAKSNIVALRMENERLVTRLNAARFVPLSEGNKLRFSEQMQGYFEKWTGESQRVIFAVDTAYNQERKQWFNVMFPHLQIKENGQNRLSSMRGTILASYDIDAEDVQIAFPPYTLAAALDLKSILTNLFAPEDIKIIMHPEIDHLWVHFVGIPRFHTNGVVYFA